MKLLVVEDNKLLADRIKRHLKNDYIIDIVHTGNDALEKVKDITYTVIIVDLGLPDMSGATLCRLIRQREVMAPLLVVTGLDSVDSRVSLLNAGADDYVTKPFHSTELIARVAALARRPPLSLKPQLITYDDVTVDTHQRTVFRGDNEISLRRKEFDILAYMLRNHGRVLSRAMIINHVWDSSRTQWSTTVDVHIKHLRDKIDRPFSTPLIKTVYGFGYGVGISD